MRCRILARTASFCETVFITLRSAAGHVVIVDGSGPTLPRAGAGDGDCIWGFGTAVAVVVGLCEEELEFAVP